MFIAQRNHSRNKSNLTNSSHPTNRAILDEQPLFIEQARLSREATAAQKKLERPLKPQARQAISLNKSPSKSDNLGRPLQPKRNPSKPLQPKHSLTPTASTNQRKTDNLEATVATFYQGDKSYTGE